jgi:hypothetical protein
VKNPIVDINGIEFDWFLVGEKEVEASTEASIEASTQPQAAAPIIPGLE